MLTTPACCPRRLWKNRPISKKKTLNIISIRRRRWRIELLASWLARLMDFRELQHRSKMQWLKLVVVDQNCKFYYEHSRTSSFNWSFLQGTSRPVQIGLMKTLARLCRKKDPTMTHKLVMKWKRMNNRQRHCIMMTAKLGTAQKCSWWKRRWVSDFLFQVEKFNELFFQSKTLASDSGVIFSPPSIMREALDDSELYLNDDEDAVYIARRNREPAPKVSKQTRIKCSSFYHFSPHQVLDPKWEKYTCGQTKDQVYMTNLARATLKKTSLQPRSLNFYSNN